MTLFRSWRTLTVTVVLTLASACGALTLQASEPTYSGGYKTVTRYKTVTVMTTKTEKYTRPVTRYDYCGKPYQSTETYTRSYQVPVKKVVPYTTQVKVSY